VKYDIVKNTFQRNNASAYQLSILVGVDSLVYSVTHTESKELLVIKSIDFEVNSTPSQWAEMLRKENLLELLYRRVKIALLYPRTTFVPSRLFNENEKGTYLEGLTNQKLGEKAQEDDSELLGIKVIYPPKSAIGTMLAQRFPAAKFYNSLTAFLHGGAEVTKKGTGFTVFTHILEDRFFLSLFEKERLLFCNTFNYQTASDVMYFVLLTMEQYGANPETAQLYLSGKIVERSDIYTMLHRYILKIDFLPPLDFVKIDDKFSSIPSHFFFPLHAMTLL